MAQRGLRVQICGKIDRDAAKVCIQSVQILKQRRGLGAQGMNEADLELKGADVIVEPHRKKQERVHNW